MNAKGRSNFAESSVSSPDRERLVEERGGKASAKLVKAERLIRKGLGSHKGVVSYQVVQEFFNVALKRFVQPIRRSDAEQYLVTVFRPMLSIHSSAALYGDALHIHFDSGFSWYNSLIVAAAIQAQCKVLFSEDMQHGQKISSLEIVNPFL